MNEKQIPLLSFRHFITLPLIFVVPQTCTLTVKGWKLGTRELRMESISTQTWKEGPGEIKNPMHQAQDRVFIT